MNTSQIRKTIQRHIPSVLSLLPIFEIDSRGGIEIVQATTFLSYCLCDNSVKSLESFGQHFCHVMKTSAYHINSEEAIVSGFHFELTR